MVYCIILIVSLFIGHALWALELKRSVMMYVTEHEINTRIFTHRIDTIDGMRKELWVIDGMQVPEHEYYDQFALQEALEQKKQRQKESEKVRQEQDFIVQEQRALFKKILQRLLSTIETYLNKLSDARLEPYLNFNVISFPTQESFNTFIQEEVLKAQHLLSPDSQASLKDLQDTIHILEKYPERCMLLYQHTLQLARERSDDTRLLKDLLYMVAESGIASDLKH